MKVRMLQSVAGIRMIGNFAEAWALDPGKEYDLPLEHAMSLIAARSAEPATLPRKRKKN